MKTKVNPQNSKVIFLSFYENTYSRSGVYFNKNLQIEEQEYYCIPTSSIAAIKTIQKIVQGSRTKNIVFFIMSPSHKIAIYLRFFTMKKILLDAGWTLSESTFYREKRLWSVFKDWIIDFLSFHMSNHVLVESQRQKIYCSRVLLCMTRKMSVVFTGFNEILLHGNISMKKIGSTKLQPGASYIKILFRGKNNQESGIKILLDAAKLLENQNFHFTICTDFLQSNFVPAKNISIITEFLSWQELSKLYSQSDIAIGQISQSTRLNRTIPHKAFEAGYFGVPYISSDAPGIRELYPDSKQVYYLENSTVENLIRAITFIGYNKNVANQLSEEIAHRYRMVASQMILQKKVSNLIKSL